VLAENKSIEYGLRLLAGYAVVMLAVPIVFFLSRSLFQWLDKLEDKLKNANSQKRN
jgi:hypothetical protein